MASGAILHSSRRRSPIGAVSSDRRSSRRIWGLCCAKTPAVIASGKVRSRRQGTATVVMSGASGMELSPPSGDDRRSQTAPGEAGQPPAVIAHAWKARQRFRARYTRHVSENNPDRAGGGGARARRLSVGSAARLPDERRTTTRLAIGPTGRLRVVCGSRGEHSRRRYAARVVSRREIRESGMR